MHISDIPAFVWWCSIGMAICFLLGYFQLDDEAICRGQKIEDSNRYSDDFILMAVGSLGLVVVVVCLKYSVTIPKFFLLRVGLFGLAIMMIPVVCGLFWWISRLARILSMNNIKKTEHYHRRHHRVIK